MAGTNIKRALSLAIGKYMEISIPRDAAALEDNADLIVHRKISAQYTNSGSNQSSERTIAQADRVDTEFARK